MWLNMQNTGQRKRTAAPSPGSSSSKKRNVSEGGVLRVDVSITSRVSIGFIGSGNMARALVEGMLLVPGRGPNISQSRNALWFMLGCLSFPY